MSREYTRDEVREMFMDHVRNLIDYWSKVETPLGSYADKDQVKARLEGLAHSLLVMLDGGSVLPGFLVIPAPHPEDKPYCIEEEEDYFPPLPKRLPKLCDIAGSLHETLFQKGKEDEI